MLSPQAINAKISTQDEYPVNYVQDWFGEKTTIYQDKQDGKIYADIRSNEQALIYWCLQYGELVELVEPAETREKIKDIVAVMQKKYN